MSYENFGPGGDYWVRESWSRTESHAYLSPEGEVRRRAPAVALMGARRGVLARAAMTVYAVVAVLFRRAMPRLGRRGSGAGKGREGLAIVRASGTEGSGCVTRSGAMDRVRAMPAAYGKARHAGVRSRGA